MDKMNSNQNKYVDDTSEEEDVNSPEFGNKYSVDMNDQRLETEMNTRRLKEETEEHN